MQNCPICFSEKFSAGKSGLVTTKNFCRVILVKVFDCLTFFAHLDLQKNSLQSRLQSSYIVIYGFDENSFRKTKRILENS